MHRIFPPHPQILFVCDADADADADVYSIAKADADADADVIFIRTADADADANVENNADDPQMRMRMQIFDTSLVRTCDFDIEGGCVNFFFFFMTAKLTGLDLCH